MHGSKDPWPRATYPALATNTDASVSEVAYNSRSHKTEPSNRVRCKPSPATPLSAKVFFSSGCATPPPMRRKTFCWWVLTFAMTTLAADPPRPLPVLNATVTKVNDGDSIEVALDSGPARV